MDYEDIKREEEKKKLRKKEISKEDEGKECPQCHMINEFDARFCEECGYNFEGEKHCPNCGAKIVSPNADICEVCGEWLLEGKCKFCYAELEEGAAYCAECGNPVAGIVCTQCGQLSYFDFCKHCNIPLTESAIKMVEEVKNDPDEKEFFKLLESVEIEKTKKVTSQDEELLKMKAYTEKVEQKRKKKTFTPLFSDKQKESISDLGNKADKEVKKREEAEKKRLEKLEAELNKMSTKTFSDNQKARRYFNTHRPKNVRGWLCNAYGTLHSTGPEQCGDPSQGGHWVI